MPLDDNDDDPVDPNVDPSHAPTSSYGGGFRSTTFGSANRTGSIIRQQRIRKFTKKPTATKRKITQTRASTEEPATEVETVSPTSGSSDAVIALPGNPQQHNRRKGAEPGMKEVMSLLQDISSRLQRVEEKVDRHFIDRAQKSSRRKTTH